MTKQKYEFKNETVYYRTNKKKKYGRRWTLVDMELHNDKRLGGIHLGIMTHILAQANTFIINKGQILKRLKLPEKKFNDTWRELEEYGYIQCIRLGKGKGVRWIINEVPNWNEAIYKNEECEDGKGKDTTCTDTNCTDADYKDATCTDTPLTNTNSKTNTKEEQGLIETTTNNNKPSIAPSANFPQREKFKTTQFTNPENNQNAGEGTSQKTDSSQDSHNKNRSRVVINPEIFNRLKGTPNEVDKERVTSIPK